MELMYFSQCNLSLVFCLFGFGFCFLFFPSGNLNLFLIRTLRYFHVNKPSLSLKFYSWFFPSWNTYGRLNVFPIKYYGVGCGQVLILACRNNWKVLILILHSPSPASFVTCICWISMLSITRFMSLFKCWKCWPKAEPCGASLWPHSADFIPVTCLPVTGIHTKCPLPR